MAEKKTNQITVQKVAKNYDKVLSAFGGMVGGKALSHFLDKAITSAPVQGLVGIELSEDLSKYVKPLVVTGTGLTLFAASKNPHLKYAGIGVASMGLSDLANVITGKDYLAGLQGVGFGDQDDYDMIDINTGQTIAPAPELDLPDLTGQQTIGSDGSVVLDVDDYEEVPDDEYDEYNEELDVA